MLRDAEGSIERRDVAEAHTKWPLKLPQQQRFDVSALRDRIAGRRPLILDLENLTELGLKSPVKVGDVFRDLRFDPTPREVQIWGTGAAIVAKKAQEWGLGRGFLNEPSNQFYLATLADKSFKRTQEPDYKPGTLEGYADLRRLIAHRIDTALIYNDAHLARLEEHREEFARAALYLYSQMPIDTKIHIPKSKNKDSNFPLK